jgi:hypothetical protein
MFGRPLWEVYQHKHWRSIREFAHYKLLRGNIFNEDNKQHVFAAVAARICLDPTRDSKESAKFATDAVDSHLRVLTGTNIRDGVFRTITPSELVVSEAMCDLLVKGNTFLTNDTTGFGNWEICITKLANSLIYSGFVNKGLKGELYARLMCVLARDKVLTQKKSNKPFP